MCFGARGQLHGQCCRGALLPRGAGRRRSSAGGAAAGGARRDAAGFSGRLRDPSRHRWLSARHRLCPKPAGCRVRDCDRGIADLCGKRRSGALRRLVGKRRAGGGFRRHLFGNRERADRTVAGSAARQRAGGKPSAAPQHRLVPRRDRAASAGWQHGRRAVCQRRCRDCPGTDRAQSCFWVPERYARDGGDLSTGDGGGFGDAIRSRRRR